MDSKQMIQSRYQQIALVIAKKIQSGQFPEGMKLSGRSLLSSEFQVSAETIRKSIKLLTDFDVVFVEERVGIFVRSKESANIFIERHQKHDAVQQLYKEVSFIIEQSIELQNSLQKKLKRIQKLNTNSLFPFQYFKYEVRENHPIILKTILELNIYEHTKTMIFAYEFDDVIYQAPDPNTKIIAFMTLYFLGNKSKENETISYLESL